MDRLAHLDGVARHDDGHLGQGAHDGDVLQRQVGRTLLGGGGAGVVPDDLGVAPGVGHRDAHLVEAATGQEVAVRVGEGHPPHRGHAGRGADDVALGDAEVEEPVREPLAEAVGVVGLGAVAVEHEDVVVLGADVQQPLDVARAGS